MACYFWYWSNWHSIDYFSPREDDYVYGKLFDKIKQRSKLIFDNLKQDLKTNHNKELLLENYTTLVESFWEDLCFLVDGVRDPKKDKFGARLPIWIKKSFNKEEMKEVKKSNINMLTHAITGNELINLVYHSIE